MFLQQQFQTKSITTLNSFSELEQRFSTTKKARSLSYLQSQALTRMNGLLNKKFRNKKCYSFQVLKQFIIFPESSYNSSCITLSKYDPLLFTDQALHSLQKILETQLIQRKIWAFINLKMQQKAEEIKQFAQKSEIVVKKMCILQKEQSFKLLKQIGKRGQRESNLQKHVMFNLSITNGSKQLDAYQKTPKLEHNFSHRTAQSDKETNFAMKSMVEMKSFAQSSCRGCSCYLSCCCCNSSYSYNLEERINYLKRLQQMVLLRERSSVYK